MKAQKGWHVAKLRSTSDFFLPLYFLCKISVSTRKVNRREGTEQKLIWQNNHETCLPKSTFSTRSTSPTSTYFQVSLLKEIKRYPQSGNKKQELKEIRHREGQSPARKSLLFEKFSRRSCEKERNSHLTFTMDANVQKNTRWGEESKEVKTASLPESCHSR